MVLGIIALFICMSISPSVAVDTVKKPTMPISNGNTLYVGGTGEGNYTSIQDAIDNASNGDTVFVYKGSYYENLRIDKNINLLGEDMIKTVIDGGEGDATIKLGAYVNLSNFTIQNSEVGIMNLILPPPNNIYKLFIFNNIISSCKKGISITGPLNHIICDNILTNNEIGINFFFADNCEISNNNIISNDNNAYFEYLLFFQFMPRIKWKGNYWDDWNMRIPKPIKGFKVFMLILRPGSGIRVAVFPWLNFDKHPAKEPYDIEGVI